MPKPKNKKVDLFLTVTAPEEMTDKKIAKLVNEVLAGEADETHLAEAGCKISKLKVKEVAEPAGAPDAA